jgi:hypothetical protein
VVIFDEGMGKSIGTPASHEGVMALILGFSSRGTENHR